MSVRGCRLCAADATTASTLRDGGTAPLTIWSRLEAIGGGLRSVVMVDDESEIGMEGELESWL